MHPKSLVAFLLLAPVSTLAAYSASPEFESWITSWNATSYVKLTDNIGPRGAKARDVPAGTLIASPSKQNPNYFYQWTRDSALSIREVIDAFERGDRTALQILYEWVDMQIKVAHTDNPSGNFYTGGLGEPKFNIDGTAYFGAWGRPQRDGPALRASSLIRIAHAIEKVDRAAAADFKRKLYDAKLPTQSLLKADLEYTSHLWSQEGFDPWEEERGYNLYPIVAAAKALRDGAAFARAQGDNGAATWYAQQAAEAAVYARRFWDSNRNILIARLNSGRNGLNCDTLLGANHNMNPDVFPPWSDEILATLDAITRQMAAFYPIARQHLPSTPDGKLHGVPIGRYTEDIYDGDGFSGGNPWFLCTAGTAETLYKAVTQFGTTNRIVVSRINQRFINTLLQADVPVGTVLTKSDSRFNALLRAMVVLGDEFLAVVRKHQGGSMAEQFDRHTGYMRGASDLTWSYASFVTAVDARVKAKPLVN